MRPHFLAAVCGLLIAPGALAMTFVSERVAGEPSKIIIRASGEIFPGDDAKLHDLVGRLPANTQLVGLALDSLGGNYLEGVRLATSIHNSHIKTAVVPNGMCASACFLMFAGGDVRLVFEGARVGVHSASENGEDSLLAEGVTTLMARQASELGVPAAIIGKMVTTPPDRIAWLTPSDLRSMNVSISDTASPSQTSGYVPGSALSPGSAAPTFAPAAPAPNRYAPENQAAATITPAIPAPSTAFMQGRGRSHHLSDLVRRPSRGPAAGRGVVGRASQPSHSPASYLCSGRWPKHAVHSGVHTGPSASGAGRCEAIE